MDQSGVSNCSEVDRYHTYHSGQTQIGERQNEIEEKTIGQGAWDACKSNCRRPIGTIGLDNCHLRAGIQRTQSRYAKFCKYGNNQVYPGRLKHWCTVVANDVFLGIEYLQIFETSAHQSTGDASAGFQEKMDNQQTRGCTWHSPVNLRGSSTWNFEAPRK